MDDYNACESQLIESRFPLFWFDFMPDTSLFDRVVSLYVSRHIIDYKALGYLSELDYLRELHINNRDFTNRHLADIKCRELTLLDLNRTSVGGEGFSIPNGCTHLVELSLARTNLTDNDVRLLTRLPALRTLDLSGTSITDECIPFLEMLPQLDTVTLSRTSISPSGIARFSTTRPNVRVVCAAE